MEKLRGEIEFLRAELSAACGVGGRAVIACRRAVDRARNAVFYLCWTVFGVHPAPYLWLAFLTHLLNVWLLFRVITLFTGSRMAATLGAAAWGACTLQRASVGYYAVYGHVLAG